MRQSDLHFKTAKACDTGEISRNAQLLTCAGFVAKLQAGVYSYLPLGLRVLNTIENIIRQEMDAIGSQQVLLPALQPRENWEVTGRWDTSDALFTVKSKPGGEMVLGSTHEEVVTPLIGKHISSYRDLPISVYQIQTGFRDEVRAEAGLLHGREFRMKNMYSFHATPADLDAYYKKAVSAYRRILSRCGIGDSTVLTAAPGGIYSKFSHEFQTISESGEDTICLHPEKNLGVNKDLQKSSDILKELGVTDSSGALVKMKEKKGIKVGSFCKPGTHFSRAFGSTFENSNGQEMPVLMGCYRMGLTRLLGAISECCNDEKGLIWPKEVAPFDVHLVSLTSSEESTNKAEMLWALISQAGLSVLYDDRPDVQAGEKLADSDRIGIPVRVVLSEQSLETDSVELKPRASDAAERLPLESVVDVLLTDQWPSMP